MAKCWLEFIFKNSTALHSLLGFCSEQNKLNLAIQDHIIVMLFSHRESVSNEINLTENCREYLAKAESEIFPYWII